MKLVIIESPFAMGNGFTVEQNITYARACVRHSLMQGEAPFASHLLYTQPGILDDLKENDRMLGMRAGFRWGRGAELVAVYKDHGISGGIREGIIKAHERGIPVEYRSLEL